MLSKLPIIITAFVVAVNAQSPSSSAVPAIPSLTPCVTECITKAAALDDCVSFTNLTCVCTSAQFQATAGACIEGNCSSAEFQDALALQQAECAALSLSVTGPSASAQSISFTTPASGSATGTVTSPVATSSGSSPSSSGSRTSATGTAATTPSSAASSLVGHSGIAALIAMIASFLAL